MTVPGESASAIEAIRRDTALASRIHDVIENVSGVLECAVWPSPAACSSDLIQV